MAQRDVMYLIALCSVMLAALCVAKTPIPLGYIQDVDDSFNLYAAAQVYSGLKAAELEINNNNLMSDVNLEMAIRFIPGPKMSDSDAAAKSMITSILAANNDLTAILAPDYITSRPLLEVMSSRTNKMPIIAPRTTSVDVFTARHLIHLFPPFQEEYVMMLHHALHASEHHCNTFAVLYSNSDPGVVTAMETVDSALASLGLPGAIHISLTFGDVNRSRVQELWFGGNFTPYCGLLFLSQSDAISVVEALNDDSRFSPSDTGFFCSSIAASSANFSSIRAPQGALDNFHVVQYTSDPQSSKFTSTSQYQSAMTTWLSTNPSLPSALSAQGGYIDTTPNYPQKLGYLIARFAATAIASRCWKVNATTSFPPLPAELLDSIYSKKLFSVGEIVIGLFNDQDLSLSNVELSAPAFCNTGGRRLYMSVCYNNTLTAVYDKFALGEVGVAYFSSSLSDCRFDATMLQTSLNIIVATPQYDNNSVAFSRYTAFTNAIIGVLRAANTEGFARKAGRLAIIWRHDYYFGVTNTTAYLDELKRRYSPFALVGGYLPTQTSRIPSFWQSGATQEVEDPALASWNEYSQYDFKFLPTIADYIHSLAAFAAYKNTAATVLLISDTTRLLQLGTQSLNTFQFDLTAAVIGSSQTVIDSFVDELVATAQRGGPVFAFLTTNNATVAAVMSDSLARKLAPLPTASLAAISIFLPWDVSLVYAMKQTHGLVPFPLPLSIYFTTYLPEFWMPQSSTSIGLKAVLNTTDPSVYTVPVAVRGLIAGGALYAAAIASNGGHTAAALTDAVYKESTIISYGVSVGPVFHTECSSSIVQANDVTRACQCTKGARRFWALSYRDLVQTTAGGAGGFSYFMSTCGVKYLPLQRAAVFDYRLVVGLVVPFGFLLIVGLVLLVYYATKPPRDNSMAPQDSNEPFAMVFTDIQSSTSLWARCPLQMSNAVELHHEIMRKLVSKHRGYEVKTIGDSFMVAFKRARDAVDFAIDIQTTFFDEEWDDEIDTTYKELEAESEEQKKQGAGSDPNTPGDSTQRDATFKFGQDDPLVSHDEEKTGDTTHSFMTTSVNPIARPHAPSVTFVESQLAAVDVVSNDYEDNWNGIRVRVGLHWGTGSVKLDPVSQGYDYYGTVVNTAARVEGVGNGGQVLLTKEMFDELARVVADLSEVIVANLGPQPLRGLSDPVTLLQLSPKRLAGRRYGPLRLDVENAAEEDSESCSTMGDEMASQSHQSSALATTPELYTERLSHLRRTPAMLQQVIVANYYFLNAVLSTTKESFRKDFQKEILKRWRVTARRKFSHESNEIRSMMNWINLIHRVVSSQFSEIGRRTTLQPFAPRNPADLSIRSERSEAILMRHQSSKDAFGGDLSVVKASKVKKPSVMPDNSMSTSGNLQQH